MTSISTSTQTPPAVPVSQETQGENDAKLKEVIERAFGTPAKGTNSLDSRRTAIALAN